MKKYIHYLALTCLLFGINLSEMVRAIDGISTSRLIVHLVLCIVLAGIAGVMKDLIFKKFENIVEIEPKG